MGLFSNLGRAGAVVRQVIQVYMTATVTIPTVDLTRANYVRASHNSATSNTRLATATSVEFIAGGGTTATGSVTEYAPGAVKQTIRVLTNQNSTIPAVRLDKTQVTTGGSNSGDEYVCYIGATSTGLQTGTTTTLNLSHPGLHNTSMSLVEWN